MVRVLRFDMPPAWQGKVSNSLCRRDRLSSLLLAGKIGILAAPCVCRTLPSILENMGPAIRKRIALIGTPLLLTRFLYFRKASRQFFFERSVRCFTAEYFGGDITGGLRNLKSGRAVDAVVLGAESDDGGLGARCTKQGYRLFIGSLSMAEASMHADRNCDGDESLIVHVHALG